jgi:hypothetical protein
METRKKKISVAWERKWRLCIKPNNIHRFKLRTYRLGGGWEVLYQSAMIPSHESSEISHAAIDQTQICDGE